MLLVCYVMQQPGGQGQDALLAWQQLTVLKSALTDQYQQAAQPDWVKVHRWRLCLET